MTKSDDGRVKNGGAGWPGMTFEFNKIREFARVPRAREDWSSGELDKGVGSQGERTDHGQLFGDPICRGEQQCDNRQRG